MIAQQSPSALQPLAPTVVARCATVQDYLIDEPRTSWASAQATFAIHNLSPDERSDALARLVMRVAGVAIVEFDVPELTEQSARAWSAELAAAGFISVTTTPVCRYWWADAVLVTASGRAPTSTGAATTEAN